MTAQELFTYLTQDAGLDEATSKIVMENLAKNDKVAAKAGSLKQQSEYDEIQRRVQELQESYAGDQEWVSTGGKKGRPGAKAYQDWYNNNFHKVIHLQEAIARYTEKYGALDEGGAPANKPPAGGTTLTQEDIDRRVHEVIQSAYAPVWTKSLTSTGAIVERHVRSGRKKEIDWTDLEKRAQTNGGDLNRAYEEWDAPEREAAAKAAQDAEVERRVKEEVAKRQTQNLFPAGGDGTPSSAGSPGLTRGGAERKYDRSAVIAAAVTGQYDGKAPVN